MPIAQVEQNDARLRVVRLNQPFIADIKCYVRFWLGCLGVFIGMGALAFAIDASVRQGGVAAPLPNFLSWHSITWFAGVTGAIMLIELIPDFIGLQSPRVFDFDKNRNSLRIDNRPVGSLDSLTIRLQDSIGPSRRAFRLVAMRYGVPYVIAQTQRITVGTVTGKEFGVLASQEARQSKYRLGRWADYEGATTGYDPAWPEYREIFALRDQVEEFLEAVAA